MVFTNGSFSEVAIESWSEWNLKPRPLIYIYIHIYIYIYKIWIEPMNLHQQINSVLCLVKVGQKCYANNAITRKLKTLKRRGKCRCFGV